MCSIISYYVYAYKAWGIQATNLDIHTVVHKITLIVLNKHCSIANSIRYLSLQDNIQFQLSAVV